MDSESSEMQVETESTEMEVDPECSDSETKLGKVVSDKITTNTLMDIALTGLENTLDKHARKTDGDLKSKYPSSLQSHLTIKADNIQDLNLKNVDTSESKQSSRRVSLINVCKSTPNVSQLLSDYPSKHAENIQSSILKTTNILELKEECGRDDLNSEYKSNLKTSGLLPVNQTDNAGDTKISSFSTTDISKPKKIGDKDELNSESKSSSKDSQLLTDISCNDAGNIQHSSLKNTEIPELKETCGNDLNSECNSGSKDSQQLLLPDKSCNDAGNFEKSLKNTDISEHKETCKNEVIDSGKEVNLNVNYKVNNSTCMDSKSTDSIYSFTNVKDASVEPILELGQNHKVKLYAEDKGPKLYPVKGNIVTPPIITKNLSEAFKFLPVFGMPKNTSQLDQFQIAKTREYVGCDLSDEEFSKLAKFCSPDYLRTGNELMMTNRFPTQEPLSDHILNSLETNGLGEKLCLVKKLKLRIDKDTRLVYMKKLKYRGLKLLPLPQNEDYKISLSPLEPGKDLIFRVRVYRPFYCSGKERNNTRHSVFSNDIVLLGRQKLTSLRDRLVCANDVSMRVDVSENPDVMPSASAKELFPSGFLFINNVFYVDTREGCKDHSTIIRQWAKSHGLGDFPRHDMTQVSIEDLHIKLGHPEVYVHQGNCEHLFTFSEVRLLNATDPLRQSVYPYHTAISQNQTIYCTTCAEFGAKWIVTGCPRVPFDPAFFCDTCFRLYLYKDGKKICEFKAYNYRGNEINLLKPVG